LQVLSKVEFHSAVDDVVVHTIKLLRKAYHLDARVTVVGVKATIERLDAVLWTDNKLDFVPHVRCASAQPLPDRLARTPIWLVEDTPSVMPAAMAQALTAGCSVVVNLGTSLQDTAGMSRLIEVVSQDPADRQSARLRWRAHEAAGRAIEHHPMGQRGPSAATNEVSA
jgi:DNA polymerase III subunit chi